MKKWTIISIILAIIIIISLVIIFYPKSIQEKKTINEFDLNELIYNVSEEQEITFISSWIEHLERCQGHSQYLTMQEKYDAGYNQDCQEVNDLDNQTLDKLKSIEDISGILLYDGNRIDSNYNLTECETLWKFTYQTIVARLNYFPITIYKCSNNFYLNSGHYPGAPDIKIYYLNLNKSETYLKLLDN